MKKILLILSLLFLTSVCVFAQNEEGDQEGGKIQERLKEYLQKRLGLTKSEADKFSPVYLRYFNELRKTHQESKDLPQIDRQQKILEIRLRYRNEFKPILGEDRANKVFIAEQEFRKKVLEVRQERMGRPNKNFRSLLQ
jgi:hypothetical protein